MNPLSAETQGCTEGVIGDWFERDGRRKDVILATKHSGTGVKYVRDGAPISAVYTGHFKYGSNYVKGQT